MLSIVLFYEIVGKLIEGYYKYRHPDAPTSCISQLVKHVVQTSYRAFPLYVCVPFVGEIFVTNGWSAACVSIEDCGGTLVCVRGVSVSLQPSFDLHGSLLHLAPLGVLQSCAHLQIQRSIKLLCGIFLFSRRWILAKSRSYSYPDYTCTHQIYTSWS